MSLEESLAAEIGEHEPTGLADEQDINGKPAPIRPSASQAPTEVWSPMDAAALSPRVGGLDLFEAATPYRSGSTQSSLDVGITPSPPPPRPSIKREVGSVNDVSKKAKGVFPTACKSSTSSGVHGVKKQLSFSKCEVAQVPLNPPPPIPETHLQQAAAAPKPPAPSAPPPTPSPKIAPSPKPAPSPALVASTLPPQPVKSANTIEQNGVAPEQSPPEPVNVPKVSAPKPTPKPSVKKELVEPPKPAPLEVPSEQAAPEASPAPKAPGAAAPTPKASEAVPAIKAASPTPKAPEAVPAIKAASPTPKASEATPVIKAAAPTPGASHKSHSFHTSPVGKAPAPKASQSSTPTPKQPAQPHVPQVQISTEAVAIEPTSYSERQKHFATFKRQVSGETIGVVVPDEFLKAWQEAVSTNSKSAKGQLFQLWCAAGGQWGKMKISHTRSREDRNEGKKRYGWRSRDQLMVMYNGNQKLVDDLADRKRSENLVKEHPDFPENPQMNMFWVLLDISMTNKDISSEKVTVDLSEEVDPNSDAGQAFAASSSSLLDAGQALQPMAKFGKTPKQEDPKDPKDKEPKQKKQKTMPEEPIPAGKFMLDKLLGEITTCKIFPVKLAGMKHQDELSTTMQTHCKDLETSYFQIKNLLPKAEGASCDEDALWAAVRLGVERSQWYSEDKKTADAVCRAVKPKEPKKKKGKTADEES